MIDRPLVSSSESDKDGSRSAIAQGIRDREGLLRFLAGRQFTYLAKEEDEDDEDAEDLVEARIGSLSLEESCRHVGFNGRWNKKADTCYCWWVAGTLAVSNLRIPCQAHALGVYCYFSSNRGWWEIDARHSIPGQHRPFPPLPP